jgi:IclR helix-turn-helix domain
MSLRKAGVTAAVVSGGDRVLVELSAAQVNDVIRVAADAGHVALLLSSLEDVKVALMAGFGELEDPRLSRSLLQGLLVLACFPLDGSCIGNVDVARMLDLHLSTTHRYISTLTAVGLLERDPDSRKYQLGMLEAP